MNKDKTLKIYEVKRNETVCVYVWVCVLKIYLYGKKTVRRRE